MNKHQALAIKALDVLKGDDAQRARIAFSKLTESQMHEEFGHSGITKAEILAQYEREENEIEQAIIWVKSIKVEENE